MDELDKIRQFFFTYDVIICDVHFKMFRYNPAANYQPNGGRYLQVLLGKDLYKQTIVMSSKDSFPVRFLNIFVDYPLGQMHVGDRTWTNWNKPSSIGHGGTSAKFPKIDFQNLAAVTGFHFMAAAWAQANPAAQTQLERA